MDTTDNSKAQDYTVLLFFFFLHKYLWTKFIVILLFRPVDVSRSLLRKSRDCRKRQSRFSGGAKSHRNSGGQNELENFELGKIDITGKENYLLSVNGNF